MTNVPGAGFVALLAIMAVLVVLPILAGVSLVVARATGLRIEWSLLAVHTVVIGGGVIALGATAPFGMEIPPPSAVIGLLRFVIGVLAAGLAVAGVAEGGPIAAGAVLAAPAALCGLAFERAAARSGRFLRAA